MEGFEEHWEGWLRSATLIGVAGLVFVGWYVGLLPDGVVGWPLLVAAVALPVGSVLYGVRRAAAPAALRAAVVALAVASALLALWPAASVLGPGAVLAAGDLDGDAATVAIPPTGGPRDVAVYAHGSPASATGRTRLHLTLTPAAGKPIHHTGDLEDLVVHSRRRAGSVSHHDIVWPLRAPLDQGATLSAESPDHGVRWPVHVEVHRAPPSPGSLALVGGPLAAVALAAGALGRRWAKTHVGVVAVGALGFALLFGLWFAPGTLAKTVLGAGFGAIVAAGLVGAPLAWLTARPFVARRPAARS